MPILWIDVERSRWNSDHSHFFNEVLAEGLSTIKAKRRVVAHHKVRARWSADAETNCFKSIAEQIASVQVVVMERAVVVVA